MLAPPCSGRAHWGKAGQPWADPCFDGAAHYPHWCDFGCAVQVCACPPRFPQVDSVGLLGDVTLCWSKAGHGQGIWADA